VQRQLQLELLVVLKLLVRLLALKVLQKSLP
jgi:hypothetical protein